MYIMQFLKQDKLLVILIVLAKCELLELISKERRGFIKYYENWENAINVVCTIFSISK